MVYSGNLCGERCWGLMKSPQRAFNQCLKGFPVWFYLLRVRKRCVNSSFAKTADLLFSLMRQSAFIGVSVSMLA